MEIEITLDHVSVMNEWIVGNFFRSRGFRVTKLDMENITESACDWLVQVGDSVILCEVKTITSVRAGDETQANFSRGFENPVRNFLEHRSITRNLPFHVHFHSDRLQIPSGVELTDCLGQFASRLRQLEDQQVGGLWFEDFCNDTCRVTIRRLSRGPLETEFSLYGSINIDRILTNLRQAYRQLNNSSNNFPDAQKIVILAFAGRLVRTMGEQIVVFEELRFEGEEMWAFLDSYLESHNDLSAIAVLREHTRQPSFSVLHNPYAPRSSPLDHSIFANEINTQFIGFEGIPRSPIRGLNFSDIRDSLSPPQEGFSITVEDYRNMFENPDWLDLIDLE
jgi:hypothetical protein